LPSTTDFKNLLLEVQEMISVKDLRDKASRYYRLSRMVTSHRDIELFESLGAEAEQAAADMEAEQATQRKAAPPVP
jgi:hypothetical protein